MTQPIDKQGNLLDEVSFCISTGFYSGLSPKAPGTAGSAACAVMLLLFNAVLDLQSILIVLSLLLIVIGTMACHYSLQRGLYASKSDPQQIVIDEFAGLMVALIGLPLDFTTILFGFFAFRLFDILKPPPASHAERLPGAYGIMADDLVAGIMANVSLRLLGFVGIL